MVTREDLYNKCNNLPDGWDVIINNLIDKLIKEINYSNLDNYQLFSAEDSFGRLLWNDYNGNTTTEKFVREAEQLSKSICRYCGENALRIIPKKLYRVCNQCYKEYS